MPPKAPTTSCKSHLKGATFGLLLFCSPWVEKRELLLIGFEKC